VSVASDLDAAFAEISLTVPVLLVRTGATTRGFLDRGVAVAQLSGIEAERGTDVLHIKKGSLAGIRTDDELRIGETGAEAIVGTEPLFVHHGAAAMQDDGAFDHLMIAAEAL